MLIAVLYIAGGSYLLLNAPFTLDALTMAVAVIFILEGIFQIISYFQVRDLSGSGWLILAGGGEMSSLRRPDGESSRRPRLPIRLAGGTSKPGGGRRAGELRMDIGEHS